MTHWLAGLGGGCCDRSRTKARFVTEDAAGDTLLHGDKDGADYTASNGAGVECCLDDGLNSGRNVGKVKSKNQQAEKDVEDGHERHDVKGDFCDTLETADNDHGCETGAAKACNGRRYRNGISADVHEFTGGEYGGHSRGDAVHLGDGADTQKSGQHAEDGEQNSKPLKIETEAFLDAGFDVVERSAQNLAVSRHLAVLDS